MLSIRLELSSFFSTHFSRKRIFTQPEVTNFTNYIYFMMAHVKLFLRFQSD